MKARARADAGVVAASPPRAGGFVTGWKSGVAGAATDTPDGRPRACFASHLPPEIPQPAPRGVHCARLSAGLRAHGHGGIASTLPAASRSRGGSSAVWRGRSQLPLRGSAGLADPRGVVSTGRASPASLFIRRIAAAGTDRHNISWPTYLSTLNIGVWRHGALLPRLQGRCGLARYSALRISIRREAVRSKAPARRSPAYSAGGSAAAVHTRLTWRS